MIEIQSNAHTTDPDGWQSSDWTTLHTVRAAIKPINGNEVFAGGQLQSRASHKILIRYQSDLADIKESGAYRVLFDNRIMGILYVNNLAIDLKNEGKFYQQLVVEENSGESNG